jgi:hypothetical protein
VYREELKKYFGWHDLFVLWRGCFQDDAGVLGGVDKILWLPWLVYFMAWLFQEDAVVPRGIDKILRLT